MTAELDIEQPEALLAYLRETGRIAPEERPGIQVLAGGVSNRTVLVERSNGEGWVLKQALAKLRVQVDWFSSPERIQREALGMYWLNQLAPPGSITPLVFEDAANHLLAMQAVPQPHANWKKLLLGGQVRHKHSKQFGHLLGTIHRKSTEQREEVGPLFADWEFFETLRLEPYYAFTAAQVPEAGPFLQQLIEDTRATRLALVHGDYSPKNVLVYKDSLILLDHEVIHFGDPAFDLGFALTHLLSKAHHLPHHRQKFIMAIGVFWQAYQEALGDVAWRAIVEEHAVRHTLGCLLARVAGRSPLEYLSAEERARQRAAVVALMQEQPGSIIELRDQFIAKVKA